MNTPNTPANGGQILTGELLPCPFCGSSKVRAYQLSGTHSYWRVICKTCESEGPASGTRSDAVATWSGRTSLAAVSASEPVSECRWPNCESEATQQALAKEVAESLFGAAAPAPVSGMPDLAKRLNEIDRHLAKCRFTERHAARQLVYSMLHEVCGTPSPQAPDTTNPTGEAK